MDKDWSPNTTEEKTKELVDIHARNVQRLYWFRTHTWIILALLVSLLVLTVFQSLIVWEGDLLPYYGAAIRQSRDPDRSLRIAVESHEQTASLRVICSLILLFGLVDHSVRWLFLTFAGLRVKPSFNRALRIVIFCSFCIQCFSIALRIGTLTTHVHWVSVLGLVLNVLLVVLQAASFVEIADYYHEYHRALQLALDSTFRNKAKQILEEERRQQEAASSSSTINSMIGGESANQLFPSWLGGGGSSGNKNKKA